ncbi:microsomal glutathione S-transferase 1-like [Haliotis rufescens]|uniref:microsomal glutathione S-transferase 1-like n=1 Tax=Haliotis rufescens TaxID=6454 RepID=UPI001EB092D9|nr:microsomal glutathione S-transferase 1-like [Haliotis rufescens]
MSAFNMADQLSYIDNPVFSQFAFYGSILIGKTVLMSPLTALFRMKNETFSNPEDLKLGAPGIKVNFDDQTVERVRRCHQNDLENILPFAVIGVLYVLSDPLPHVARRLFQTFTAARLIHTVAYLAPLPQPIRFLAFGVGAVVNMIMVGRVIICGTL